MQDEQTYIKGFNTGYKLAQFNPELFEKLRPSLKGSNEYEHGIMEGAAEYSREKEKGRTDDLDTIRSKQKARDKDFER